MAASERLSLLLEARTTGEQDLRRLESQINQVLATANKTSKAGEDVSRAAAQTEDRMQQFGQTVREFVSAPLDSAKQQATEFLDRMGAVGVGVGTATAIVAASVTAWVSLTKSLGDTAREIQNVSLKTGLTSKEVQQFGFAARSAGVNAEGFTDAMEELSKILTESSGEAEKTRKRLRDVGISLRENDGQLRSSGKLWLDLAATINKIEDPYKRLTFVQKIFGDEAIKLLPVFQRLSVDAKKFETLKIGFDDKTIKDLSKTRSDLETVLQVVEGLVKRSGTEIVLKFKPVLDSTSQTLEKFTAGGGNVFDLFLAGAGAVVPGAQFAGIGAELRIAQALREGARSLAPDGSGGPITGTDVFRSFLSPRAGTSSGPNPGDARARSGASSFLRQFDATNLDSLRTQLQSTQEQRDAEISVLRDLSTNGSADAISRQTAKVQTLAAAYRRLEFAVKNAERAEQEADAARERLRNFPKEFAKGIYDPGGNFKSVGFRSIGAADIASLEQFQAFFSPSDINLLPGGARSSLPTGIGTFGAAGFGDVQGQRISLARQDLQFQQSKIQLLTGPGGELAAINEIARAKLAALEQEKELGADLFDIEQQRRQVAIDTELQILSLRRSALETGKDQIFSVLTGQTSARQFARGTALTIGRNAFSRFYDSYLGPQLGKLGGASGLGGLLQGTAFDPMQGVDGNTRATNENTIAIQSLTAALTGAGFSAGGGTGLAGLPSIFGGGAGGGKFGSIFSLFGLGKSKPASTNSSPTLSEDDELQSIMSVGSSNRLARGVGIAGAGVAGAFGVVSGIKQGGLRGGLSAGSSGLGATAAILTMAGVSGPAAPIIAGVALGLEMVKSFLPDPKMQRDRRINSILDSSAYSGPMSGSYEEDVYGRSSFYDKRGVYQVNVYQEIKAWDASTFTDHSDDVADAMRLAIQKSHPVNSEILQLSNPY